MAPKVRRGSAPLTLAVVALTLTSAHAAPYDVAEPYTRVVMLRPTSSVSPPPPVRFGHAVAIAGDGAFVLAGAPDEAVDGIASAGVVYVFHRDAGWNAPQKLAAPSGGPSTKFGSSIALSRDGHFVAIGASGAVHVFERIGATWAWRAQFDGAAADDFGIDVAIDATGTHIVVGAPKRAVTGGLGAVVEYVRTGDAWTPRPAMSEATSASGFGQCVAMTPDGTRLVVGAPGNASGPATGGALHRYDRDGDAWIAAAPLVASDGAVRNRFGWDCAIADNGGRIAVGAPGQFGPANAGVYVFTASGPTWSETKIPSPFQPEYSASFGTSVALGSDGTRLAIGSPYSGIYSLGSAAVYAFGASGWTLVHGVSPTLFNGVMEEVGHAVAVAANDEVIVGAPSTQFENAFVRPGGASIHRSDTVFRNAFEP